MAEIEIREVPTGSEAEWGRIAAFFVYLFTSSVYIGFPARWLADYLNIETIWSDPSTNFEDANSLLDYALLVGPFIVFAVALAVAASSKGAFARLLGLWFPRFVPVILLINYILVWRPDLAEMISEISSPEGTFPWGPVVFFVIALAIWYALADIAWRAMQGELSEVQNTRFIGRVR